MHRMAGWEINDTLLANLNDGDECILSFVDGQPAGYAWAHLHGRPEIIPGLAISVPSDYIYNYAGFTDPHFRGAGLQSYRHHLLLGNPQWKSRVGLVGYVRAVNFASRKGQAKSGYRRIGTIWITRWRGRYLAAFSPGLHSFGIRRLPCEPHPDSLDSNARAAA